MTCKEFSEEFDILLNSYGIPVAFGQANPLLFDEYEKSLFLTKAQESVVISLYNGNLTGDSFEKTEELRRYLSDLVKTYSTTDEIDGEGLTKDSHFFHIPKDILFITYESVLSNDDKLGCAKGSIMEVVPVTQDELHKTKENPFRGSNKRRVLRLDVGDYTVELISSFSIDKYQIRYLSKPEPIILIDLPDGLTIGKTDTFPGDKENMCKLNPAIHRTILEVAVNLAIKSRVPSTGK